MSETVREKILQDVLETLETVTVASGYDNTLASVQRWKQKGNDTTVNVPCVVIVAGTEKKEPKPNPLMTCMFTVVLTVWTQQVDSDETPTDTILDSLLGDIEKALMIDITRGGYAQDSFITDVIPFETVEGQPQCGLIINLDIQYRHLQDDPGTAG
jgi:hypothetical protein